MFHQLEMANLRKDVAIFPNSQYLSRRNPTLTTSELISSFFAVSGDIGGLCFEKKYTINVNWEK